MYVKIIKSDEDKWYHECEGGIFKVDKKILGHYDIDKTRTIPDCDCIEVNLDTDQISEEFANKLLSNVCNRYGDEVSLKVSWVNWKEKGFIEQSREDELRGYIDIIGTPSSNQQYKRLLHYEKELREILDKKIKELKE